MQSVCHGRCSQCVMVGAVCSQCAMVGAVSVSCWCSVQSVCHDVCSVP